MEERPQRILHLEYIFKQDKRECYFFWHSLFLCPILPRLCRARARMYAHTNEIIDIYLIILYIYRKQVCNYSKAKKDKTRNNKQKERKAKERKGKQQHKDDERKKRNAKHKDEKRRERNGNKRIRNEKRNAKK